jgi:hypothetical protein
MLRVQIVLFFSFFSYASSLITNITTFETGTGEKQQLVMICGDQHQLGSWEDNITQFFNLAELTSKTQLQVLFLVENLISPNDYFNRPQDKIILEAKEDYIFESLTQNYINPNPKQMPTVLHFWGCSQAFYAGLCDFLEKPSKFATRLAALPVINIDNRHRNIYYGEALIGWPFPPYCRSNVRTIQQAESESLTLFDLLAPQAALHQYLAKSSGWSHSIFDEILERQIAQKNLLVQELGDKFYLSENSLATIPLAKLGGNQQREFYNYLQHSPLEIILREMVEANALWHITQRSADIIIVLAGTNHTGHTENNWGRQTPGLTPYLNWLGFKQISETGYTSLELIKNKQDLARRARNEVPDELTTHIKNFTAKTIITQPMAALPEMVTTNNQKLITDTSPEATHSYAKKKKRPRKN